MMKSRIPAFQCGLMIVLLALCASLARADIVTLKDGSTFEGTVVKENGAQVVLETTISNIKTTKTFPRYKVRSVEYKPVEEVVEDKSAPSVETKKDESPAKATDDEDDDSAQALEDDSDDDDDSSSRHARHVGLDRTLFMVIPVEGTIGEQTNAQGLGNALMMARRKHIKHIVFTIDSPGGYIYDAIETLKLLKEYDEEFVYHAVVIEGAISAASVYVAASDDIWVRPDARVGGAVSYSKDQTTGAAEVDAKMNSIWAAEIAARAETKGYPPELFRAMAEPGAEVWIDADNKVYPSRPSTPGAQQLDSSTTVLTMRAGQMIQVGIAKEFKGEPRELGELLGIENWSELRGVGQRAMEAAGKDRTELTEKFEYAVKVFRRALEELEQNDPGSYNDYSVYIQPNGARYPDGESMRKWRERTDKAVKNCDDMLAALTEIASINKRAQKIGALHLVVVPNDMGHEVYTKVSDARTELIKNRQMVR